ncbi:hypothetical protein SLA2020_470100 [Shorea laevis]
MGGKELKKKDVDGRKLTKSRHGSPKNYMEDPINAHSQWDPNEQPTDTRPNIQLGFSVCQLLMLYNIRRGVPVCCFLSASKLSAVLGLSNYQILELKT